MRGLLSNEMITEWINETYTEHVIRNSENAILQTLKARYESDPTEENDATWFDYSDFIVKRRKYK